MLHFYPVVDNWQQINALNNSDNIFLVYRESFVLYEVFENDGFILFLWHQFGIS